MSIEAGLFDRVKPTSSWQKCSEDITQLSSLTYPTFKSRYEGTEPSLSKMRNKDFLQLCTMFSKLLMQDMPKAGTYLAYHKLIGSTPDAGHSPKLDFPGIYSVARFYAKITELCQEYDPKKTSVADFFEKVVTHDADGLMSPATRSNVALIKSNNVPMTANL